MIQKQRVQPMATGPTLIERGPVWDRLQQIPDTGPWAYVARTDVRTTLAKMSQNVNDALRDRLVIEFARAVVSQAPARDYEAMNSLIDQFMRRRFKFVRDADGIEVLHTPAYLIHQIQSQGVAYGDCDDAAQLVATLAKSVGMQATFVAMAFNPKTEPPKFTHVATIVTWGNNSPGYLHDSTKPSRYGGLVPPATALLRWRV